MAHRSRRLVFASCLVVAICGSFSLIAFAQSGGPYNLSWHNMGPGGAASGGNFTLNAAIGQPDAGTMSGGNFTLSGGFLAGASCSLPGDINGDGQVSVIDIQLIAQAWPQSSAVFPYDQNGDGVLDIQDITLVTAQFGDTC